MTVFEYVFPQLRPYIEGILIPGQMAKRSPTLKISSVEQWRSAYNPAQLICVKPEKFKSLCAQKRKKTPLQAVLHLNFYSQCPIRMHTDTESTPKQPARYSSVHIIKKDSSF